MVWIKVDVKANNLFLCRMCKGTSKRNLPYSASWISRSAPSAAVLQFGREKTTKLNLFLKLHIEVTSKNLTNQHKGKRIC